LRRIFCGSDFTNCASFLQYAGTRYSQRAADTWLSKACRHGQRHAVVALARREVVSQRIAHIVHQQLRRELLGGDAGRLVGVSDRLFFR